MLSIDRWVTIIKNKKISKMLVLTRKGIENSFLNDVNVTFILK